MKIDLENLSSDECNEKSIASVVEYSLSRLGIHPDSEISIRFVDEVEMTDLHLKWMQLDGPTDVLSFPMDLPGPGNEAVTLGDIVIAPVVAAQQAATAGHSIDHEIFILAAHGLLHILGYDHVELADEVIMFELQESIVATWKRS